MLINPKRLEALGILGINQRNQAYISRYNSRKFYPLVDDKLKTKRLTQEYDISTPELRYVIHGQHEIKRIAAKLEHETSFVIKPSKGSGGKGILVISEVRNGLFIKPSGAKLSGEQVYRHMSNIVAGLYSLGGLPDIVMIERMVVCEQSLAAYSQQGVPDIRIIVFKGFPVMAMLRLSTIASDGKANLHQGAVGVGLDIGDGRCLKAVQFSRAVTHHPDKGKRLDKILVPGWKDMLLTAASCYESTSLGYIGVDMVVDQHLGPQLLELNARPGLAIQIANGQGLLPRLKHIESLKRQSSDPAKRVTYARERFGHHLPS